MIHAARSLLASVCIHAVGKGLTLLAFLLATCPSSGQELPTRGIRNAPGASERAVSAPGTTMTYDPFTTESLLVGLRSNQRKPIGVLPPLERFKYVVSGDSISPMAVLWGVVRSKCPGFGRTATQVNGIDLSLLGEDGRPVPGAVFRSLAASDIKGTGGEFQLLIRPEPDALSRVVERTYEDIRTVFKTEAARTTDTLLREHLVQRIARDGEAVRDTLAKISIEASNPSIAGSLLPGTSFLFLRSGRYLLRVETTMQCKDDPAPIQATAEIAFQIDEMKDERTVDPIQLLRSELEWFESLKQDREVLESEEPVPSSSP